MPTMAADQEQLEPELAADYEELLRRLEDAEIKKVLQRYKVKLVKKEVTSGKALQGLTAAQLMAYGLSEAAAAALKVAFPSPTTTGRCVHGVCWCSLMPLGDASATLISFFHGAARR